MVIIIIIIIILDPGGRMGASYAMGNIVARAWHTNELTRVKKLPIVYPVT